MGALTNILKSSSDSAKITSQITSLMESGYSVTEAEIGALKVEQMKWNHGSSVYKVLKCLAKYLALDQAMVSFLWRLTASEKLFKKRFDCFNKIKPSRFVNSFVGSKPYGPAPIKTILEAGFCFSWNCVLAYAVKGKTDMIKMVIPTVGDQLDSIGNSRLGCIMKNKHWPKIIRTLVEGGMPANALVENDVHLIARVKYLKPKEVELIKFLENWDCIVIPSPVVATKKQLSGITHYVLKMEYAVNII